MTGAGCTMTKVAVKVARIALALTAASMQLVKRRAGILSTAVFFAKGSVLFTMRAAGIAEASGRMATEGGAMDPMIGTDRGLDVLVCKLPQSSAM